MVVCLNSHLIKNIKWNCILKVQPNLLPNFVYEEKVDVLNTVGENYIEVNDCEVDIVENIVQNLAETKSSDWKSRAHVISMVGDIPNFVDFFGVERFDVVVVPYLVYIFNFMKAKERVSKINLFAQLMSCKFGKKIGGLKYSKYLFALHGSFQISKIN